MNFLKNKHADLQKIILSFILMISLFFISTITFASGDAQNVTNKIISSSSSVNDIIATDKYDYDVSVNILKTLFGGLPIFGSGEDSLQHIFGVFNLTVLLIGGILAGYNLFLTLTSTANTGKVLGKYNATMMPLRVFFGVAFILPIANGYALVQVVIMWLVLQGIAFSDYLWSSFTDDRNLASALAVEPVQPEARMLAKNILMASVCMAAVNKQAAIDGDNIQMAWSIGYGDNKKILNANGNELIEFAKKNPNDKIVLQAGEVKGRNGISDNSCGSVTIQNFNSDKTDFFDGVDKSSKAIETGNALMGGYIATNNKASTSTRVIGAGAAVYSTFRIAVDIHNERKEWKRWVEEMSLEHAAATDYLIHEANKLATSIVENVDRKIVAQNNVANQKTIQVETFDPNTGETTGYTTKAVNQQVNPVQMNNQQAVLTDEQIFQGIDALAQKYQTYVRSKAARSYKDGVVYDTIVKNANTYGWMLAGSFYSQMGGMTDAINQIALQTPVSSATHSTPDRLKNTEFNSKYLSKLNYYFDNTKTYKGDPIRIPTVNKSTSGETGVTDRFMSSGLNLSVLTDGLTQYVVNYAISDQEHPLMQLKRLGNLMFATGSAILMVMMSGFGDMTDNAVVFLISMFGYTMIAALYAGGITMSYVIPMMPALIWLGMCFGWIIMVMQAMVASPLWIVMHLAPHQGDDFIGAQKNGYMLVLSLILRPVLMVIGFIFSIIAMNILGYFINNFFLFIYSMSQVGTNSFITALFGVFVIPVMYCAVVYIALKEMLSIMHKVPDELLSWFGGGGPQLGGYAQKLSDGSIQAFGIINQRATNPFDRMKQGLAERQSALQQKLGNLGDKDAREESKLAGYSNAITGGTNSGGFSNTGGESSPEENGYVSGDIHNNMPVSSAESWTDAINSGVLQGNTYDIAKARKAMYPVPEQHLEAAMGKALQEVKDDYNQRSEAQGGSAAPISNMEFANRVNAHLNRAILGDDVANTMEHMQSIANNRTGNPNAGNTLMRDTYRKIAGVANRTGYDYDTVAKQVGGDIATAMNGFANDKGTETINEDGSVNLDKMDGIRLYAHEKGTDSYKQAGTMINNWKHAVRGNDETGRSDSSLDGIHYNGKDFQYEAGKYDAIQ